MSRRIATSTLLLIFLGTLAVAQTPPPKPSSATTKVERGPHGGELHAVDSLRCEIVFHARAVRVYVYDEKGNSIPLRNTRGRLSIQENDKRHTRHHDLYPESATKSDKNCLYGCVNLSHIPDGAAKTSITIHGLPTRNRRPLSLFAAFKRTPTLDELAVRRQRICPVSGKLLNSMGQPVKIALGKQSVFVCCQGCVKQVRRSPETYLRKLKKQPNKTSAIRRDIR